MEEQISESGQWPKKGEEGGQEPERLQRVPPTPPPIRKSVEEESLEAPIFSAVPPPPVPEIKIRTLESDIKSVQGGEPTPLPESVLPSELKEVLEQPETVSQLEGPVEPPKAKKILKIILLISGILIFGGGLGIFGYYVIYPLINPAPIPEPQPPASAGQPILPVRLTHKSYFIGPMSKESVKFPELNLVNISKALQEVSKEADGILKEVEILDMTGGQIYLNNFLSNFLPLTDADKNNISQWLEPDFTAFLYYDDKGVWPGYVLKIKSPETVGKINKEFLSMVELFDIGSFYLSPAGTFQPFKNGKISAYFTRYAVGSQPGAAFNYGFFGNYLIFSASYNGLKTALPALGL